MFGASLIFSTTDDICSFQKTGRSSSPDTMYRDAEHAKIRVVLTQKPVFSFPLAKQRSTGGIHLGESVR
jgi:hypothetical protein